MPDKKQWMELAVGASREAGNILKEKLGTELQMQLKGSKNLVTEADKASEARIMEILREGTPGCSILAEESPEHKGTSELKWIIDPLDGTTNFAHGLPIFSVSIGLEVQSELTLGVVYNPISEELFTAEKGKGAFLNGSRLQVSPVKSLEESLLVTGFAYEILTSEQDNLDFFGAFSLEAQSVRRLGSAALDFCYVAAGRLDGYWELSLHPWDMAAGVLVVLEAGGKVSNLDGSPIDIYNGKQVSSNGLIHDEMLEIIRETSMDR